MSILIFLKLKSVLSTLKKIKVTFNGFNDTVENKLLVTAPRNKDAVIILI